MDTTRLDLATETAKAMQLGLLHRQRDLLDLEQTNTRLARGTVDPMLIIDQAEDIRRALRIHAHEQVDEILVAVGSAKHTITSAINNGELKESDVPGLARQFNRLAREMALAEEHTTAAHVALKSTGQAMRSDPNLHDVTYQGVNVAADELEKARQAVFQLTEQLPQLRREIAPLGESEVVGPRPEHTPEQTLGLRNEHKPSATLTTPDRRSVGRGR